MRVGSPAATAQHPVHTYLAIGAYPVTLTVTDDEGATDTATQTVTVELVRPPTAAFVSSAPAGGRNVALYDTGPFNPSPSASSAIPVAESAAYYPGFNMLAALNAATEDTAWLTAPAAPRYGVVRLWNNQDEAVSVSGAVTAPTGERSSPDKIVDISTAQKSWTAR